MNHDFFDACRNGKIDIVKQLLTQIDPSAQNNWTIKVAAENGHQDVVELLLKDPRVDPSAEDNWAIKWAAFNCYHDIVELLEQHQYKIDNVRYNEMAKLK